MPSGSTGTGKSTAKSPTKARSSAKAPQNDATRLLEADHRQVEKMFADFEKASAETRKAQLAEQICLALKVHTQIEEELFYPAAREALKAADEEMIDEAVVEHASAKQLIAEIEEMDAGDDLFDAKIKVLSEMIEHHVGEEEKEMFPKLRRTDMDLGGLATRLASRKEELTATMARSNGRRVS